MSKILNFLNTEEKTTRGQQLIVCGCLFGLWALNNSLIKKGNKDREEINKYKALADDLQSNLEYEVDRKEELITKIRKYEKIED